MYTYIYIIYKHMLVYSLKSRRNLHTRTSDFLLHRPSPPRHIVEEEPGRRLDENDLSGIRGKGRCFLLKETSKVFKSMSI